MTDRIVDAIRIGGASSDEPYRDALVGQHPPVSLEEAIAEVDGWRDGFGPFRLHQIARALRSRIADLEADADNDYALLQGMDAELHQICEAVGVPRGTENWGSWIDRLRAEMALLRHNGDNLRSLDEAHAALITERDELRQKVDALYLENTDLRYRLGRTGAPLDGADGYRSAPVTLEHTLSLMDVWREDVECWGLHQMCRALRGAYDAERRVRQQEAADADHYAYLSHKLDQTVAYYIRGGATQRLAAMAAVPCARAKSDGVGLDCPCPDYRYAACCNLRVALWPGEAFPTDYLSDEGFIHLFEPVAPAYPGAPRKSAGCVRLVGFEAENTGGQ